ncbi:MAG: hypothetical protein COB54_00030 [Alphaproteobacteria bacterium]|nr:MAG: hypothetical protein COB54_00030 [Alphaproteobacteria bacterium]
MDRISALLARNVAETKFEDLSDAAIESARRATLDTVGCILAGSSVASIKPVVDLTTEWGGAEQSRLLGFSTKCPAPLAAWCNGMMARVLEIDDCTDFRPIHPTASIIPALLAISEARGGISGRDFLTAIAVAQDLIIRLGMAVRVDAMVSGRYNLFKIFAPAAAVSRALNLDVEQTHNALGIAYSYACGEGQSAPEGATSLPLQQGTVAQSALVAALLAEKGNTGSKDFLFGRAGYFNAFEPDPILPPLTDRLGSYYYGEEISVKPYAACRCCHEAIELAQRYFKTSPDTSSLESIKITVAPNIKDFVGGYIEEATNPYSTTAAQFSLPFTVAATLTRGDFFLRELQPDVIGNPHIRSLAQRVEVIADPEMATDFVLGRAVLEIKAKDRDPVILETSIPPGNPSKPLDFEDCMEKVLKCAEFSINPPGQGELEIFFAKVKNLENLEDVANLTEGL